MSLRVIAGSARGTRLKPVPGDGTRPIMDRVKESLFNIIGQDILDARFLDLFAGTGSVGIEALSRGASYALLLDIDREAIRVIQHNLQVTHLAERAAVRRADALALVASPPGEAFDYVYVAPPQYARIWEDALQRLDAQPGWVTPGGKAIAQIDPSERRELPLTHFSLVDERRYGRTLLMFFERLGDSRE